MSRRSRVSRPGTRSRSRRHGSMSRVSCSRSRSRYGVQEPVLLQFVEDGLGAQGPVRLSYGRTGLRREGDGYHERADHTRSGRGAPGQRRRMRKLNMMTTSIEWKRRIVQLVQVKQRMADVD